MKRMTKKEIEEYKALAIERVIPEIQKVDKRDSNAVLADFLKSYVFLNIRDSYTRMFLEGTGYLAACYLQEVAERTGDWSMYNKYADCAYKM